MAEKTAIVLVEVPMRKQGFLGISLGRQHLPAIKPGMHLFASIQQPDGKREVRRVMEGDSLASAESIDSTQFYHVGLGKYSFSPTFSRVVKDEQGHELDCRIHGQLSVDDSRLILTSFAIGIVSPNAPLTPILAESWLANRIADNVSDVFHDAVRDYSTAVLRDRRVLPPSWWEKRLAEWIEDCGIYGVTVQIDKVTCSGAQAEAAEAETARLRDLERVMEAKRRERELEVREAAAKAEYSKRKKRIESDLKLSDHKQTQQLQLLEKHHRIELMEADEQIAAVRREAEKAAVEHEGALARLRQDADTVKQVEEQERQAESQYQEVLKGFEELKSTLVRIADLPDNLLAQLVNLDARKANMAAERLVSPEFGISASSLAAMGFRVDRQSLVEELRTRAAADPESVVIQKNELRSRDIGTARVKGLPIDSSLQLEFRTERDGFVTLLNIGTSGSIYVHVPNPYVSSDRAQVRRGHAYGIPGSELLPWERLERHGLDYVEIGPPGWEHIAVLVSDEPLVSLDILERATVETPLTKLTNDELTAIGHVLFNMPADKWSVGILSMLVY